MKLINYADISEDKFGTPCAMYFRHLTLPEALADYNKHCCFAFSVTDA